MSWYWATLWAALAVAVGVISGLLLGYWNSRGTQRSEISKIIDSSPLSVMCRYCQSPVSDYHNAFTRQLCVTCYLVEPLIREPLPPEHQCDQFCNICADWENQ